MTDALMAGAARTDVTPPVGIDISGFCLRGPAPNIHQPLSIRAGVFSSGDSAVALVSCELVALTVGRATELRQEVAEALNIPIDHVFLGYTHTHSAPVLEPALKIGGRQEEWMEINEAYARLFRHQLISTVKRAAANMSPARSRASTEGSAAIGVNRRFRLDDGRMIIGRNWSGPVDRSVGVLRVESLDGEPVFTVLTYACHPIVLGPENELVSPDYPGEAMRVVEQATQAPCLFFQGCCGDIAPVDGMGHDVRIAERLGAQLGYAALSAWSGIETRNIEQREEIVQSYNALASLIKEERPAPPPIVRAVAREVLLKGLPLPPSDEIDRIAERETAKLEEMQRAGATEGQCNIQRIELRWVRALQRARAAGPESVDAHATVQAIRVNDWAIVGLPVEPFVRIGLSIKERLAPHSVFVCGFANGTIGYAPMPEDYPEGGYEVERAHHVYGRPTALAPECAGLLIDTAVELVCDAFD